MSEQGAVTKRVPKILTQLGDQERSELMGLVEKKAWTYAGQVPPLTGKEQAQVRKIAKKHGDKVAKAARDRFYRRHHWDSLRWFLFGGYVDLPILSHPGKAWDPSDNPYVKVFQPGFAFTKDEHDEADPFKRLPDKDYLRLMAYAWVHEDLLLIPKSRQMMVTWLFCCIACHETIARSARRTAFISKKFDDADSNIDRVQTVTERLPSHRYRVPGVRRKMGELNCDEANSTIMAMGEEAKGLRQYTFSWIFSDEMAFQEQADEMVRAALPTIRGGGRLTGVSTANGEETFFSMVTDAGRIAVPAGR